MRDDIATAALAYAKAGIPVFPLVPKGKTPLLNDWESKATTEERLIRGWFKRWPDANLAIPVGRAGLVVVDVDPRNGGDQSLADLTRRHGKLWLSHIKARTGGGGAHYFFAAPSNASRLPSRLAPGIDLKHGSGYIVAPPSVHPSGVPYEFVGEGLLGGNLDFAPAVPEWFFGVPQGGTLIDANDWACSVRTEDPETAEEVERVSSALAHISADCSRDEWRDVLFAILSTGWSCARDLCRQWSMSVPHRFDEDALSNILDSAKADRPNAITLGTLFAKAKANGWTDQRKISKSVETYGDISNGRRFADKYRGRFLFCHGSGAWYSWSGQRWAPCENGEAMAAAKVIADEVLLETSAKVREDATEAAKRNYTQALGVHRSIRRLEAMLQAAASEPAMSIAHPGMFDSDPLTLCVQNGAVDLRNGELIEARPEMRISRQAGAPYLWDAQCPTWKRFLHVAMQDDVDMVDFIQRICGYALTGLVDEEKLFFFYGIGANGKSVFANVIAGAMGEYAVTVRAALLARDPKGNSGDAEREKARLPGARVALINETGQGDVWDDQRVKELVSRERVSARYLHRESFDFMPTHKLLIRGNHQPGAMDGSDGFWRRIVLIGFTRQFNEAERVLDLDRQIIERELPGVLAWMVEGCLEWQRKGLQPPRSITAAIDTYRQDTDLLQEWIGACCTVSARSEGSISELFSSYERYLKEANTKAPSRNTFGRQLIQRGFHKRKSNGLTIYTGLTLANPFDEEEL